MRYLLVVNRDTFTLETWKWSVLSLKFKKIGEHLIAVGAKGYATPRGVYRVLGRTNKPDWRKPDSEWVPKEEWGEIVKFDDPANPLKTAFIWLTRDGIGIHGTANVESLGTRASHGCIRVAPASALDIYKHVRKGSPVVIL